ncbi:unnamed protein product [Periconia digitata]|uniref:Uncharacterized protein n=1 Tax=Periconia digitata TaxID=1303443 RepID=A0A9W4UFP2_9PLEO|nr:unnamed protein product [Periconia digitata]
MGPAGVNDYRYQVQRSTVRRRSGQPACATQARSGQARTGQDSRLRGVRAGGGSRWRGIISIVSGRDTHRGERGGFIRLVSHHSVSFTLHLFSHFTLQPVLAAKLVKSKVTSSVSTYLGTHTYSTYIPTCLLDYLGTARTSVRGTLLGCLSWTSELWSPSVTCLLPHYGILLLVALASAHDCF